MAFQVGLTKDKITESDLFLVDPDEACGAEVLFLGRVRNLNFGKKVVAVAYDAFQLLTEKIFLQLCTEALVKWGPPMNVKIIHRTGELLPGEISVAILVSTAHRDEAYEASRYILEQLKTRSPIWKKERYENSETEWLQGHALCRHNHVVRDSTGGREVHPHGHR